MKSNLNDITGKLTATDGEHQNHQYLSTIAKQTAGIHLSGLAGFSSFNPALPETASQGALECVYDVQQLSCSVTGLDAASLVATSSAQAIFSCLSMIKKYHLRKKQTRSRLLMCAELSEVMIIAGQVGFDAQQVSTHQLEANLDDTVAAIIIDVPELDGKDLMSDTLISRIKELDVLIYMETAGKYFFPVKDMQLDLINLDLGQLCETGGSAYAVLSNKELKSYLPCPRVQWIDNQYRLQYQIHNPLSIGNINAGIGNIEEILRIYVQFRLVGVTEILQQALSATLSARYVLKKVAESGFKNTCLFSSGNGLCHFNMNYSSESLQLIQHALKEYESLGLWYENAVAEDKCSVTISLGQLRYFSKNQLDALVDLIVKYL